MSTLTRDFSDLAHRSAHLPLALFEVLVYLNVVAIAALLFVMGALTPNGGVIITAILISGLTLLAWKRFDQGRHPCFLFLCMLTFFQCGRLLAYCFGAHIDPLKVQVSVYHPFGLERDEAGIVLLCLALSAICIYAPCRWKYERFSPPSDIRVSRYLPYLYLVFYGTLPIQLFKNYRYYEYARTHGGYILMYLNHGHLASSVPLFVRGVSLISFPVFIAIFVLERRKTFLYLVTVLYFATSSFILLLGPRMGTLGLAAVLWYVARIKSTRRVKIAPLVLAIVLLLVAADLFQNLRDDPGSISKYTFLPAQFLLLNSNGLDVTATAVKYRHNLAPFALSYLWYELGDAFVAADQRDYFPGKRLSFDVTVLLNRTAFASGYGTAGSYVGEAYVIGGIAGVTIASLLIGLGLRVMYKLSSRPFSLFIVAMVLPDVLSMPRGQLLDWLSVLFRSAISIALLAVGWELYRLLAWLRPANDKGALSA